MTTKSNFRLSLASLDMIQVINYLIISEKMFKKFEYKILYKRIFLHA